MKAEGLEWFALDHMVLKELLVVGRERGHGGARVVNTPEETQERDEARAAISRFFQLHFDAQARGGR